MTDTPHHPPPAAPPGIDEAAKLFRRRIDAFRRQVRRYRWIVAVVVVIPSLLGMCLASWLIDWTFRLDLAIRAILCLGMISGAGYVGFRLWRLLTTPVTDDGAALALERFYGSFRDQLISAVQFLRRRSAASSAVPTVPTVPAMTQALENRVIVSAAAALRDKPAGQARGMLNHGRLALPALIAGLALGLFSMSVSAWPEGFGVWVQRNLLLQDVRWPRNTQLELIGFADDDEVREIVPGRAWRVPQGNTISLLVGARGVMPATISATVHELRDDGRRIEVPGVTFELVGDDVTDASNDALARRTRWLGSLGDLEGRLELRIYGGDDDLGPFELDAIARPEVQEFDVRIFPPRYTGAGDYTLPGGSDVRCVRQSHLVVRARSSSPLSRMEAAAGTDSNLQSALVAEGAGFNCSLTADTERTLTVTLVDENGFSSAKAFALRIVPLPDRAPRVTVVADGLSDRITPVARLALKITSSDDWGITQGSFTASVQRDGGNKLTQPLAPSGIAGVEAFWTSETEVSPLQPQIGDFVLARATVADNNTMDGPSNGVGELQFRVVSAEELSGELLEKLNAERREFEKLFSRHRTSSDRFDKWIELKVVGGEDGQEITPAMLGRQISDIAGQERTVVDGCAVVAGRYAALLRELWLNRLIKDNEHASQQRLVVRPLEALLTDSLQPLREGLRRHALADRGGDRPPPMDQVAAQFRRATAAMEKILDSMKRLETFTEALHDLQGALEAHQRAMDQTKAAQDQRTADFLRGKDGNDGNGGNGGNDNNGNGNK